jgi:hypothetical protein
MLKQNAGTLLPGINVSTNQPLPAIVPPIVPAAEANNNNATTGEAL